MATATQRSRLKRMENDVAALVGPPTGRCLCDMVTAIVGEGEAALEACPRCGQTEGFIALEIVETIVEPPAN